MGWTFTHKPDGQCAADFLREQLFDQEDESGSWKALATAQVGSTIYAAVERFIAETGRRVVFAAVVLTRLDSRSRLNFGWNAMEEDMGPRPVDCPERILKLLSPTDNVYALEWRAACREKRRVDAMQRKQRATIAQGDAIKFEKPIYFRFNGEQVGFTEFVVVDKAKRVFALPKFGNALVRLRCANLRSPYSVVARASGVGQQLAA